MKTGWWKVRFDVTLDGIGIDFDELPASEKRRIQRMLALGAVAGEVTVPSHEPVWPWIGDDVILNFGGRRGAVKDIETGPDGRTLYLVKMGRDQYDWFHAGQFTRPTD